jgi:hypothetical protein
MSNGIIEGVVQGLEDKIIKKKHEMTLEQHQQILIEAYNQEQHLKKVREEI